jgi:hypothetical protein
MPPAATRHPQQQQHPAAAHPGIRGVDVLKAMMDDGTTPLRCLTSCVCAPSTCSSSDCRKRVETNSGLRVARACLLPFSIVETSMNSRLCIVPPLDCLSLLPSPITFASPSLRFAPDFIFYRVLRSCCSTLQAASSLPPSKPLCPAHSNSSTNIRSIKKRRQQ